MQYPEELKQEISREFEIQMVRFREHVLFMPWMEKTRVQEKQMDSPFWVFSTNYWLPV